ncbi:MAG: DnaJ domain-containing protein [Verrucomicrobiota bacterium]|nr:DnaJ domain-containing protein [Verrucomicrobiota bacterium]
MPDYFALLDEPRRPWLDPDSLRQKFLALSSDAHPDKIHDAGEQKRRDAATHFAELNAAYQCLADPKSRLRHLVELEQGARPADVQQVPPALADLFAEVATACRNADAFLAERSRATSPLVRAQLFERAHEWMDTLGSLQKRLGVFHDNLLDELKSLDAAWTAAGREAHAEPLRRLEELYRRFGYFNRWNSQIKERMVQLTL